MSRLLAVLALVLVTAGTAAAHVTELAVLRLAEIGEGRYTVTWTLKPNTDVGEGLAPIYPAHCSFEEPILDCGARGLIGTLGFERIGEGQSAAMFRIRGLDGGTRVYTLTPAAPTAQVEPALSADDMAGLFRIVRSYLAIGVEHILLGVDHLLFVLGLMWIAGGGWMLFKTITAFTLAHTVSLAAVTFGWIGISEAYVNALIALSIVFIGVEVIHARAGRSTLTLQYPWAVSFFFGLLHGLGFANALVSLGLPEEAVPVALVAFNVGVELGQIAFVLVVLALAWSYRVMRVHWPDWSAKVPAYAIGSIAAFWFYDRVAVLLTG
ncbi:MAG: HupE/UreJ family protein [Pseudomonadota bacterium]